MLDHQNYQFDWITSLPEAVRDQVMDATTIRELDNAETLYMSGEASGELFQVVSGLVQLATVSTEGREVLVFVMRPGDCFGEVGAVEGSSRANTATAQGATCVRVLTKRDLDILRAQHPVINEQLLLLVCRRMRLTMDMIEGASLETLQKKLLLRLHMLVGAYGKPSGDEFVIATRFSQQALGKMVGASRQSINKELHKLQKERLIRLDSGLIYVVDPDALLQRLYAG